MQAFALDLQSLCPLIRQEQTEVFYWTDHATWPARFAYHWGRDSCL